MRKILMTGREKEAIQLILSALEGGIELSTELIAPRWLWRTSSYLKLHSVPRNIQRRAVAEMKRRKLVRVYNGRDDSRLVLTRNGRARLEKYRLDALEIHQPRMWDGKWRIVFFDIPRKPHALNRSRDILRDCLKRLGLVKVQKSVWVHPFPCEDEIAYITEVYGLQPYVRIAVAESITGNARLRKYFDL